MAKTRKRNRRHRRYKHRKEKHNTEPDEVRTCVSNEKSDRSCHKSPLQLVDIVVPILTPSPKFEEELLKLTEIHQSGGFRSFRPRSKSTVPIVHSPLVDKVRCSVEKSPTILNHTNTPKSTSKLKQSDNYVEYKTPVKRIRSNSLIHSLTPIAQPTKKTKSSSRFDENKINVSFFNSSLLHDQFSTPLAKISPIHNSTPKSKQQRNICIPKNNEINDGIKSKRNSIENLVNLNSIRSLSPILKNIEDKDMNNIKVIEGKNTQEISSVTPTRKYEKFKKQRWPMSLLQVFSWLKVAVKKGFTAFKRMIYGIQKEQTAMLEQSMKCSCKIQVDELKIKVNSFQEELANCRNKLQCQEEKLSTLEELKKEIQEMKEKMTFFKPVVCMAPPPPPPPPPPPLPPPFLMMGPTPTSRPLKTVMRKADQHTNENSRPSITVDDILKVRLRKTTTSTPSIRKCPPLKPEDIFRQVKLRPPQRSQSPQILGTSPKSSLTRILKNVDTNVRSIRRLRKPQFMSFDDISRHPPFRMRPNGNDSAPVI